MIIISSFGRLRGLEGTGLERANHFTLGGEADPRLGRRSFGYPSLEQHHDVIRVCLVAFLRWRLDGIVADRTFLDDSSGLGRLLGPSDVYEVKDAS